MFGAVGHDKLQRVVDIKDVLAADCRFEPPDDSIPSMYYDVANLSLPEADRTINLLNDKLKTKVNMIPFRVLSWLRPGATRAEVEVTKFCWAVTHWSLACAVRAHHTVYANNGSCTLSLLATWLSS